MNKELILNDGVKGKLTSPKQEEGITLVALVITIIVLLILAGVSIATLTGYDSIPDNAKVAVEASRQDTTVEQNMVNKINELFKEYLPPPSITTATEIQSETTKFTDGTGKNIVVVPGGFKVRTDLATTVQKGIVIEDSIGNQFVWIPIEKVVKDDGTSTFVEFGRYDYMEIMQQSADDYEDIVEIPHGVDNSVYEMYTFRESNFSRSSPIPSTSYNLGEFITKTKENKGFYIARYTGRFVDDTGISSGFTEGSPAVTTQVPVFDGESSSECRQGDAAIACRNLYKGNTFVASDLINSYAGGTAAKCFNSCVEIGIFENRSSRQWTTESGTSNGIENGIWYGYFGDNWGGATADRWFILLFF